MEDEIIWQAEWFKNRKHKTYCYLLCLKTYVCWLKTYLFSPKNLRVSLYRYYVFLQRKVFYYKRTCFVINIRVSFYAKTYSWRRINVIISQLRFLCKSLCHLLGVSDIYNLARTFLYEKPRMFIINNITLQET